MRHKVNQKGEYVPILDKNERDQFVKCIGILNMVYMMSNDKEAEEIRDRIVAFCQRVDEKGHLHARENPKTKTA